ncbi:unnamed protein product [Boreogadus saida]
MLGKHSLLRLNPLLARWWGVRPEEVRKKINNTKPGLSKAVWGNSDDSNSDIEAALRPPAFNAKNNDDDDDDDDFFD